MGGFLLGFKLQKMALKAAWRREGSGSAHGQFRGGWAFWFSIFFLAKDVKVVQRLRLHRVRGLYSS